MTVTQVYGYAADGLRARYEVASSLAYDYLYDPQGNVVQRQTYQNAENGEPAVTQAIYDAYGALRSNVLISTDATKGADEVGFGGQYGYYTDPETGLVLCTHRYYDPGAGRWLTRDPISYQGGMNLYSYAGGNPINAIDPEGYGPKKRLAYIYVGNTSINLITDFADRGSIESDVKNLHNFFSERGYTVKGSSSDSVVTHDWM